ncbi:alpha-L-glutamate ligase [Geminicoccaceae bacterium 1502E]|nr:alpha-L-glutamate ligase [Geminicoccaceae bacterium 1502E]
MAEIHVLHENRPWVEPLAAAFEARGLAWREWFLDEGSVDLGAEPPEGVFYNRMSASSHTRGHRHAAEFTAAVLAWLERHGRRVVNGSRAIDLEISKVRQYAALERVGVRTPRTVAVVGRGRIASEARRAFGEGPVILKPNRGGKGLGVQLFQSADALADHVMSESYEAPVDGVQLLQEYVEAPEPFITRAEFVGGRFLYAVEVDTSDGGFELCPADVCAVGDTFCPTGTAARDKFTIVRGIEPELVSAYERFLAEAGVEIAGIEFIRGAHGLIRTYDVNTNTNYNADAEAKAGRFGMGAVADFLGAELRRLYPAAA